jgi:restriction system protein
MPIPDFQTLMLPILRFLEGGERTSQEMYDALAREFALTPEELAQRLPSGRQTVFPNRLGWSRSHLKAAGMLEATRRGAYQLSARGRAALAEQVPRVDMGYLSRFPEYIAFRNRAAGAGPTPVGPLPGVVDPVRTPTICWRTAIVSFVPP